MNHRAAAPNGRVHEANESGPKIEVESLRDLAAVEATSSVREFLRDVGRVLLEHKLVQERHQPAKWERRLFIDATSGQILASVADAGAGEPDGCLLELAKQPMLGPPDRQTGDRRRARGAAHLRARGHRARGASRRATREASMRSRRKGGNAKGFTLEHRRR